MIGKALGVLAVVLVIAGVAAGFALIGSPAHARLVALDNRRVDDLQTIATHINQRYGGKALPETLPAALELNDPQTHRPYTYRRNGVTRYALCATFALPSQEQDDTVVTAQQWKHHAGTQCYPLHTNDAL